MRPGAPADQQRLSSGGRAIDTPIWCSDSGKVPWERPIREHRQMGRAPNVGSMALFETAVGSSGHAVPDFDDFGVCEQLLQQLGFS